MENESTNIPSRKIWFRADWLIEACSGYGQVTWQEIGKWAKSDRLWTDDNDSPCQNNPIDVNLRWRVLNPSLKLLESLGYIDVIWRERVVTTPISWVRTCWEELETNEWLLYGVRCENFVDDLESNLNLSREKIFVKGVKDKSIISKLEEHKRSLQIKLPDRITTIGEMPPELPSSAQQNGTNQFPYSWEICKSLAPATDLVNKIERESPQTNISNNLLNDMKWLRPKKNTFFGGKPPVEFYNHDLCLSSHSLEKQGHSSVFEAIRLVNSNSTPGFSSISKYILTSEEKTWISYYLLSKDIRTLEFKVGDNSVLHPIELEVPTIIRRLLSLCSGRPQEVVWLNGKGFVKYENVSSLVALEVAKILNVELICG